MGVAWWRCAMGIGGQGVAWVAQCHWDWWASAAWVVLCHWDWRGKRLVDGAVPLGLA